MIRIIVAAARGYFQGPNSSGETSSSFPSFGSSSALLSSSAPLLTPRDGQSWRHGFLQSYRKHARRVDLSKGFPSIPSLLHALLCVTFIFLGRKSMNHDVLQA